MESTELLHRALDHATAVVEGVKPDQMSSKTPCSEFDFEPPKILMLKVHPEVSVRIELIAERES